MSNFAQSNEIYLHKYIFKIDINQNLISLRQLNVNQFRRKSYEV